MNADDMKRLLDRSLHEGGMDSAPGLDEAALAARVRGARRRRTAASAVAGVASLALVAAVVWQVGGFTNDPNPPATPTPTTVTDEPTTEPSEPTEPTEGPSDEPTDDQTDTETPTSDPTDSESDPADWSDAVFPECGDTFVLPDRTSQLVVTQGPAQPLGAGGGQWLTRVENTGSFRIEGAVAILQTVVVDGGGAIVATVDPDNDVFWGAEGGALISIAPAETLPFRVEQSYACGGEGGLLPSGEYEVYVLLTISDDLSTDPEQLEQAQGGPFPLVIDENVESPPIELTMPAGAAPVDATCGASWSYPDISTGFELDVTGAQIRSPRSVTDDIDGTSRLRITSQVTGTVFNDVVVIQNGQIVSMPYAGDSLSEQFLSAGSEVELSFGSSLIDCEGSPLPPGEYQVVVVTWLQIWPGGLDNGEFAAVAATDPVDVVLQ